jgi:general stress protein 26
MSHNTQEEGIKNLIKKIKGIQVAMMTTVDEDGSLRSRPMHTSEIKEDGVLWFFTGYVSGKSAEITQDYHVNISYADPGQDLYVSISGRATLSRDRAKIEELWSPMLKAWFPGGKDDENIGLIRVAPHLAEYWDPNSSKLVQITGFVKALLTGKPYQPDEPEEHKKINL